MHLSFENEQRKQIYQIMKRTLGSDYLSFSLCESSFLEDLEGKKSNLYIRFKELSGDSESEYTLEKSGIGIVNIFFNSLIDQYASSYSSLENISFKEFRVTPCFFKSVGSGSDAKVVVEITFSNKSKQKMVFSETGESLFSSILLTLLGAFEFYINIEKSFNRLNFLIEDSKQRNRGDLVQRYTYDLSCIIKQDI